MNRPRDPLFSFPVLAAAKALPSPAMANHSMLYNEARCKS